jgi:hypothetical protein
MTEKQITFNEIYKTLSKIDVNGFTEKKNKLTYLSWSHAWNQVASRFNIEWKPILFEHVVDGIVVRKPYLFDPTLGYMVMTTVTIEGFTLSESLFVMDGANNAQRHEKYSYDVDEWNNGKKTGGKIQKWVEPATMFDINTAIKRCLTKNLALFGLGIYIYAGEDLPLQSETKEEKEAAFKTNIYTQLNACKTEAEVVALWPKCGDLTKDEQFKIDFAKKRKECVESDKLNK